MGSSNLNDLDQVLNRVKYSENLNHTSTINRNIRFETCLNYNLEFKNGKVFFNGNKCGLYNFKMENFQLDGLIPSDKIEKIIEMSTSCQHAEFKSSSPSMILHQISVLTLVEVLPGMKSIEEFSTNRRNDLIWYHNNRNIIIEVTGKRYESRYNKLCKTLDRDLVIIDKYAVNPLTDDHDDIRELSYENDSHSIEGIYEKVVKQSNSVQKMMLYDRKLLDFFIDIPRIHVKACEEAHLQYSREIVPEVKESIDPDLTYVKRCVEDLSNGLKKLQVEEMYDYDFYAFDLNLIRGFNYKETVKEESNNNAEILRATSEEGNLEFPKSDRGLNNNRRLFKYIDICSLSDKAYLSSIEYPTIKIKRENYIIEHLSNLIDKFSTLSNLYALINVLCINRFGMPIGDYRPKKRRIQRNIRPQTKHKSDIKILSLDMMYLSTYNLRLDSDPDHVEMLKGFKIPSYVSDIFLDSRDVFELRMKKRVALAAIRVKRPMKPFRVTHWKNKSIYCECVIMGKLFQKDSGVMYVSYFTDYKLTKTQKWRLPDVENFSIAIERALALTASIGKRELTYITSKRALTLYYRLLNENSWGVSKFLKPYRYFSSGIAMGSSRTHDQIPKILSAADSYIINKLSVRYLNYLLQTSDYSPGRTPALDLGFEDIGYECFLLNLCPSRTYGSSRHLVNVLTELSDEIKLYNQNFETTKKIFDDFKDIISSKSTNKQFLTSQYLKHLHLIDKCSLLNDGRFTFSPSALLICKRELDGLTLRPELSRPPSIDELATARGSTSNFSSCARMALESINELSRKMGTSSTTRLALRIVRKQPVDLTMRMFDKDQVGGDREISILNAGFRVLQSISESFFKSLGSQSGVDLLADKHKTMNYTRSISECLEAKVSRLLTIDQTRWGPNFNTITFGLLALMTSHLSTEYYMPALICFISEFKVFEMPILEPELHGNQELSYSLPGLVGRSHMGQGIFHYASSFYHSLCLLTIKRLFHKTYSLRPSQCVIRTFCTSDDASIIAYNSKSCKESDLSYVSGKIKFLYSFFENIIHLFGIKTNKTKNIDSLTTIEFNSMYYSRMGIGSNDIKFLYSLIDPMTTGNIYRDANMVYMVFDRAINSGCTVDNAVIISTCVYLIKIRQWKARGNVVRPPSYDLICSGSDILEPHDPELVDPLFFSTGLKFSRKRRIIEQFLNTDETYSLTRIKQESNLESMLNSKTSDKYRSMQTYNEIDKVGIPVSSVFRSLAPTSISMSNEFFLREFFSSADMIRLMKGKDQKVSNTLYQKCWTKPSLFTFKMLKQRRNNDFDPLAYLISLSDPVTQIENLNDQDKFILHMFRNRTRYELDPEVIEEYSLVTVSEKLRKLTKLRIELELSSPNVVQMVFNPGAKSLEYTRQIRNWDRSSSVLSRLIVVNCVSGHGKLRHSVCYTNTESVNAYYVRYIPDSGDFREFIPSALAEWPQVSIKQSSLRLTDVVVSERILKLLCQKEVLAREKRSETPYLIVRRRIDRQMSTLDSASQFTYDFSEYRADPCERDYCYIELDSSYSYLATSFVLKQAMIMTILSNLAKVGGCTFKDIESLISGTHTLTYYTRSMMREIEWLVIEKMTSMSSEKENQEKSRNFLFDAYYNILELESKNYFPIYAMLSVTRPHYVSFRPRGARMDKESIREVIAELISHDSVINPDSDILRVDYPDRDSDSNASTMTSYDKEIQDEIESDSDDEDGSIGDLLDRFESIVHSQDNYKSSNPINELRNDIEDIMNLIQFGEEDSDSSYSDHSSYS